MRGFRWACNRYLRFGILGSLIIFGSLGVSLPAYPAPPEPEAPLVVPPIRFEERDLWMGIVDMFQEIGLEYERVEARHILTFYQDFKIELWSFQLRSMSEVMTNRNAVAGGCAQLYTWSDTTSNWEVSGPVIEFRLTDVYDIVRFIQRVFDHETFRGRGLTIPSAVVNLLNNLQDRHDRVSAVLQRYGFREMWVGGNLFRWPIESDGTPTGGYSVEVRLIDYFQRDSLLCEVSILPVRRRLSSRIQRTSFFLNIASQEALMVFRFMIGDLVSGNLTEVMQIANDFSSYYAQVITEVECGERFLRQATVSLRRHIGSLEAFLGAAESTHQDRIARVLRQSFLNAYHRSSMALPMLDGLRGVDEWVRGVSGINPGLTQETWNRGSNYWDSQFMSELIELLDRNYVAPDFHDRLGRLLRREMVSRIRTIR